MTQDYVSYIRSKVGHATIIMTFTGGILADEEGRVLLQLRGDKKNLGYSRRRPRTLRINL
ncbi:phosphohydrolase [Streptococcus dysgalactiae subsp. equisimilis]|uniref:Phosphohydrolase (MutT/nudix family protein) n=1 Tax=Streptococcus dysgalactiae subsp. equisimilis AC-2713 TaxID=759913 RepID=A0AB33R5D6_STREQ|nr:Phosphohydrolase (MutT/nudix family protein) [Streptococcus dysgalactiae subsp. equisimilis AC-2713]CRH93900.1 Uncharacterised protein [Chlamydia trachomatis]SQF68540.1 phosphohydrolase [Streptococcus dysgalactiae subsp. equisimilis]SQF77455.1 phosphohydrolase [Streptococcus dysgalactiae subsp. equisimilis]VTS98165.1 phosphohydrolase [Streptococcus dysgalactiae subsp. equisimilis]